MRQNNFISVSSILFVLLPISLVSGPFFADLSLSVISIIFLIITIKEKNWQYFNCLFFKIFLAFYFYILILSCFSQNPYLSFESSLFYFRFGIFALAIWHLLDQNSKLLKFFSYSLFITYSFVLIDAYFQFFFGKNIFGMVSPDPTRVSGLFGDELILGSFLSRLLPLVFAMFFIYKKTKFLTLCSVFLFILTDTLVFMSGERVAFLLVTLSTLIIIFFAPDWRYLRLATFVVSILLIIGISSINEKVRFRMLDKTITDFGFLEQGEKWSGIIESKFYSFSPQHQLYYLSGLKMFNKNILFGHGPKMFRELCGKDEFRSEKKNKNPQNCSTHPHSTYIQLLAETGLIGFTIVLLFFIYTVRCFFLQFLCFFKKKQIFLTNYQVCILGCFFVTLWPIVPSGSFFNNWLSIVYYLPVGFYLQTIYKS